MHFLMYFRLNYYHLFVVQEKWALDPNSQMIIFFVPTESNLRILGLPYIKYKY